MNSRSAILGGNMKKVVLGTVVVILLLAVLAGCGKGKEADTTPPVISAVAALSITTSAATITWTTDEAATSQVEYGLTTSYGSNTTLNTDLVTSHSVSLSGLSANTTYHYLVKSKDETGNKRSSEDRTLTTTELSEAEYKTACKQVAVSNLTKNADSLKGQLVKITGEIMVIEFQQDTSTGMTPFDIILYVNDDTYTLPSGVLSVYITYEGTTDSFVYDTVTVYGVVYGNDDYESVPMHIPKETLPRIDAKYIEALSDTTAPVISPVAASSITTSAATITWTTDQRATSQVEYGQNTSYGSTTTLNTYLVTSHSVTLTGLTANTTYHYQVKSKDASGNEATSEDYTFTTAAPADTTAPVISAVAASGITTSAATITWTTDEAATSQVEYGQNTSYGSTTTLNTDLVTSHSVSLSGLSANTTYHYLVKSKDETGNKRSSEDRTLTTTELSEAEYKTTCKQVAVSNLTKNADSLKGQLVKITGEIMVIEFQQDTSTGKTPTSIILSVNDDTYTLPSGVLPVYITYQGTTASFIYDTVTVYGVVYGNYDYESAVIQKKTLPRIDAKYIEALSDTTAPVISPVAASSITTSAATITWTTDEAATSQVEYGQTTSYGSTTTLNTDLVTSHSVSLNGLSAATTYHYRVKSKDASDNEALSGDYTFTSGGGNGGGGATAMMEKVPEGVTLFYFVDLMSMRADDDLGDLYQPFTGGFGGYLATLGIEISEVNSLAWANDVILLEGNFDLDGVRNSLETIGYNETEYSGVEVWKSSGEGVALLNNLIILGHEETVDDCIRVINEGEASFSDNADSKSVMDRLPGGIMTTFGVGEAFEEGYTGLVVGGESLEKKDGYTMKMTAVLKFGNETAAGDAVDDIENDVAGASYENIGVNQDEEFVIVTAEIAIDDFVGLPVA